MKLLYDNYIKIKIKQHYDIAILKKTSKYVTFEKSFKKIKTATKRVTFENSKFVESQYNLNTHNRANENIIKWETLILVGIDIAHDQKQTRD